MNMNRIKLLSGLLAMATATGTWAGPDLLEQGRRIYAEGILPDGSLLKSVGAGGVAVEGAKAACGLCHRRSGMGSQEGSIPVSPVTGRALYTKPVWHWPNRPGYAAQKVAPLRQYSRAAYDDASLVRALRKGIDSSGRPLHKLMPRYKLDTIGARALVAYLRQLSAAPVPGLGRDGMQLATIVTQDAEEVRRQVVAETLGAWSRSGALGGIPISMQVWNLEGPASTWGRQLQDYYRRQPVFAVISGAGRSQWTPVRDFCEQTALPCLFPIVDLAPSDPDDFYTMYFSTGVPLEARMLASYLNDLAPEPARIVQIVDDEAGEAAAGRLSAALDGPPVVTRRWDGERAAGLIGDLGPADVLVGWLRPPALKALAAALPQGPATDRIILSAQLAPPDRTDLPPAWRQRARWISARSDPQRLQGRGVIGLVPWMAHMKLPLNEEALLSDVYAATYFFGDALARMRGGPWNREYLLETLENGGYFRPAGAAYFSLSLGAGQREAAKGGHLLGYAGPDYTKLVQMSPRITP